VLTLQAQEKLLGKYQFEKGGYAIVGLLSESDPNDLQKQVGEFYTDDIGLLNDFKKAWVFTKESPMYACGYHYLVYITHNGVIVESFHVNLNCNVIATDKGYFFFDSEKLSQFKDRLKTPIEKNHSFQSIDEGRKFITTIKKEKKLLLTFEPIWTKYEGNFLFEYKNPDKNDSPDIVEKRIKNEIKKRYSHESFSLTRQSWSTGGQYMFEIKCNKSLFDSFMPYKKKEWNFYKANLTTYWRN